jgi:hypothetical protein
MRKNITLNQIALDYLEDLVKNGLGNYSSISSNAIIEYYNSDKIQNIIKKKVDKNG